MPTSYRQAERSDEEIAALAACIEAAGRRGAAGDERRNGKGKLSKCMQSRDD